MFLAPLRFGDAGNLVLTPKDFSDVFRNFESEIQFRIYTAFDDGDDEEEGEKEEEVDLWTVFPAYSLSR